MFLYDTSEMNALVLDVMMADGKKFVVYGDSGARGICIWRCHLLRKTILQSVVQKALKKALLTVRITVEWFFKCEKQLGSFLDIKRKLFVREMPVGLVY